MKIKEAAQYCGLTEKAIRLYEAKGLIHPQTEEKNGRVFREYDSEAIRALLTVGTLRRADFSLEQIGMMQQSPHKIPEVFAAYREEVKSNAARLTALSRVMDSFQPNGEVTLEEVADRLAIAMIPERIANAVAAESQEPEDPPVIHFHHYVWDEEGTAEEKERAYQRFLKKQERREKIEEVVFAVPRKAGSFFRRIGGFAGEWICDENRRIKTTVKLSVVFLLVIGVLIGGLVNANRRFEVLKRGCTKEIGFALKDTVGVLRYTVATGEYTTVQSETVVRNLIAIEKDIKVAELADNQPRSVGSFMESPLRSLINAMGGTYCATHDGVTVASILYDGEVTEKEMRFIEALLEDLEEMYTQMSTQDGLNLVDDVDYDVDDVDYDGIRKQLQHFTRKWSEWSWKSSAPYHLLNRG